MDKLSLHVFIAFICFQDPFHFIYTCIWEGESQRESEKSLDRLESELQALVSHLMWVPGAELVGSAKAAGAPNR